MKNVYLLLILMVLAVVTDAQPLENPEKGRGRVYEVGMIPNDADPVVIDGIADEDFWAAMEWTENDTLNPANPNKDDTPNDPVGDFTGARWKAAWMGTTLYFFVEVEDDTLVEGQETIHADNIELTFNADSIWNDSTDNPRDPYQVETYMSASQIRVNPVTDVTQLSFSGAGYAVNFGEKDVEDFDYLAVKTDVGYNVEILIGADLWVPSAASGIVETVEFEIGARIPFELMVVDADPYPDDERWRDAQLWWNQTSPDAWKDVEQFGWLVLDSVPEDLIPEPVLGLDDISGIKVYPTVTSDVVKIAVDGSQLNTMAVYSLQGRTILKKDFFGSTEVDLRGLNSGTYIFKVNGITRRVILE